MFRPARSPSAFRQACVPKSAAPFPRRADTVEPRAAWVDHLGAAWSLLAAVQTHPSLRANLRPREEWSLARSERTAARRPRTDRRQPARPPIRIVRNRDPEPWQHPPPHTAPRSSPATSRILANSGSLRLDRFAVPGYFVMQ